MSDLWFLLNKSFWFDFLLSFSQFVLDYFVKIDLWRLEVIVQSEFIAQLARIVSIFE